MYKKTVWHIILSLGILSTVVFIVGFVINITITNNERKSTVSSSIVNVNKVKGDITVKNSNSYNILVLGDSLAKGTGDEKGSGFPSYFADAWRSKTTKEIKVSNIAVNGDKSLGLLNIAQKEETGVLIENSNIIFISIGGNEITRFKDGNLVTSLADIKSVQDEFLINLRNIFKLIRNKNKNCTIIFIGLYNPFGKNIDIDKLKFINNWNYEAAQVIVEDANSIFIPTYDIFEDNLNNYLTVDGFHPNSAGYEAIAKRIVEVLKNH